MDKNTKNALINLSLIGATVGLGIYTQTVDWNPAMRTAAHFLGATAVPGFSSAFASIAIGAYEESKTKRLNKKVEKLNKKHERTNDITKTEKLEKKMENFKQKYGISEENIEYHINPKLRNTLMKSAMILGGIGYIAFSAAWESHQFSQSQILEIPQYIADISGPLIGMATIGNVDGMPMLDKINNIEEKIKNKLFKRDNVKDINQTIENQRESKLEQNQFTPWDLRNWTNEPSKFISNMNVNLNKQPMPMKQKNNSDRSL